MKEGTTLFLKEVDDPQRFGVAEIEDDKVVWIEEKPKQPKSKLAVTGLYIYPPDVFSVVPTLKPSRRGELEITDVNNYYVMDGTCNYVNIRGFWSDAGTIDSLKEVTDWAYKSDLTNGK
jgi:glucose-1-phosphate thymidylyltransferase